VKTASPKEPNEPGADSFDEVLSRYKDLVFNLSYRLLGDHAAAEDLTQEVFLRVHRGLKSFRGDSSLKTWIYRITLNAASNVRKSWARKGRRRHVSLEEPVRDGGPRRVEQLADTSPGPERVAHASDIARRLQEALNALPPEYRTAVILRDIEGLAYREIAEALEVSPGTVKSRIARARSRLRDALEDLV
jgi:RNA polymerase sigma-70 factor (ECF subfamily)